MAENTKSFSTTIHPKPRKHIIGDLVKRFVDILAAAIGLVLLTPVFLVIAMIIKRDSPGSVFYQGPRCGRNRKIFYIHKFRTMHDSVESFNGPRITAQDDPRITPIGRWLRDTKLNELPQLLNVLLGDMSFVGPRPEDPEIAINWPQDVAAEVFTVRPGITSPASVLYRNEESLLQNDQVMDKYLDAILPTKLRLDQLYVRNRSFWLDLDILFWTFLILLPRLSTYAPPEEMLFAGFISKLFRRYLGWFTIDTVVSLIAMGLTGLFWRSLRPLDVGVPQALLIAIGFAFLFSVTGALFGINRISWSRASFNDAIDLIPATVVSTALALVANYYFNTLLPNGMILMASTMAFVGFIAVRFRGRLISGFALRWLSWRGEAKAAQERVLIIGGGEAGQFAAWMLSEQKPFGAYQVVGFIDDDLYKQGMRIRGANVLGKREDIPKLVEEHDIGIIVFAIHNIIPDDRKQLLDICARSSARVVMMPDLLGTMKSVVTEKKVLNGTLMFPVWMTGFIDESELRENAQNIVIPLQIIVDGLTKLEQVIQTGDMVQIKAEFRQLWTKVLSDSVTNKSEDEFIEKMDIK